RRPALQRSSRRFLLFSRGGSLRNFRAGGSFGLWYGDRIMGACSPCVRGLARAAAQLPEGGCSRVGRLVRQLLLDPEELVVFRDPLASRERSGLDLPRVHGHREVRDRRVLGLAG